MKVVGGIPICHTISNVLNREEEGDGFEYIKGLMLKCSAPSAGAGLVNLMSSE